MYVVIMGAGRVGLNLAELLIDDGYDITIIENCEGLCGNASVELDALIICGNGTDTRTLEEANIQDADFFVAATGNDEANLLSCILVKDYGIPKIIARVSNPDHEEAFKKVGIDNVISPERTAAGFLEKLITRPNVADLTAFGKGDAEILDMVITNEKINGKKVSEVSPTKDYIIIAIYHGNKLKIPAHDTVLNKGNKISILVKRGAFKKATKQFIA
ncbi:Trk system potassium uptake protein TrkA [Methanobrevibacter cuticularis]|uniref:Trk system potassium uptake protein TrkA n=1 Tax=Methanobrevibacter cuticularis TaxID=47311 RepID=A0A166EJW3_9EURY|nr:TrkA family potassium uptake protein [Methanobrevibacter cuticularis]KZX16738.1 Trk system potassium uptake protein TrkA [Methanobrevibacter cuticularis]